MAVSKEDQIGYYITAVVILGIIVLGLWSGLSNTNSERNQLQDDNNDLTSQVDDLQSKLDQANSNIDDANQEMQDAAGNSGGTYEDMQDALDSLSTVDNVN